MNTIRRIRMSDTTATRVCIMLIVLATMLAAIGTVLGIYLHV